MAVNISAIEVRISGCLKNIEKTQNTLERHRKCLAKKLEECRKTGVDDPESWERNGNHDQYWAVCEYKDVLYDIESNQKKLAEYQKKLAEYRQKLAEGKPKYRPIFLTSNAITLSNKVQVVIRFYGEVEEIHKNFDFAHCTCSWTSWDNEVQLPTKALECIINKELFYVGSRYPLCSVIRTRKYLNRGYTINAGQYLKMVFQLNELDLHDVRVLEDQLVGVDYIYFTVLVDALEKKYIDESGNVTPVDTEYVIEIINRLF